MSYYIGDDPTDEDGYKKAGPVSSGAGDAYSDIYSFKVQTGTIADDEKERDVIQKTDVEEYPSSTPQAPLKHPLSTPQVELLIQKMSDSYMSMREMAEVCNIKDLKFFRESYITPALESGMIERLYPNHPKHPKQQYQLTTAAKEWIKKNTK